MATPNVESGRAETGWAVARSRGTAAGPRRAAGRARRAGSVLAAAVLIAMASVAVLVGLSWVRSQGAINVVAAQVQAIRDGNVEDAYRLFSRSYQAGTSLPMFRRFLRRQKRLANVKHLQFWGRSVWGSSALLWGSFEDDLGHSYPVRYLLVEEGGAWRIDRFQFSAEVPDPAPPNERLLEI